MKKKPFLSTWPDRWASKWRVGRNGLYYPKAPVHIKLRQYRYGRLELAP